MFNTLLHAAAMRIAGSQQPQNRPRGLRRRAGSRHKGVLRITCTAFAPSAIGVLQGTQPFARAQNVGLAIALARGFKTAQSQERTVNVVNASTPGPTAIVFLRAPEIFHACLLYTSPSPRDR